MALALAAIEDAIHDWLKAAVGVTVIFSEQSAPQPAMPYCALRLDAPQRTGGPADEVRYITNLANPAGQEIEQTVVSVLEMMVNIQAFSSRTVQARAWAVLTNYVVGDTRRNGNNTYRCITQGLSAGAGGPTGTGADITDGTVHWAYVEDARTARELLSAAMESLDFPSVRDTLEAAGLVVVEKEAIHNISTVLESKWQGRASLDVRFRTTDSTVEKTGYVDGIIIVPDPVYTT
jgi:hypothetical protein